MAKNVPEFKVGDTVKFKRATAKEKTEGVIHKVFPNEVCIFLKFKEKNKKITEKERKKLKQLGKPVPTIQPTALIRRKKHTLAKLMK